MYICNKRRVKYRNISHPSRNYFQLKIASNRHENRVNIKVTDMLGKVIESRNGTMPDQTLELGSDYRPGIYFVQATQGNNKVVIKVVKQ